MAVFNYSGSVTPSVRGMGLEMMLLAARVTSPEHRGCQVVMVSSGEMTLVWPAETRGTGLTMGGHIIITL